MFSQAQTRLQSSYDAAFVSAATPLSFCRKAYSQHMLEIEGRLGVGAIEVEEAWSLVMDTTRVSLDRYRFDDRLSNLERVFHSPPFSPELVAAIKLIAPQFEFRADEHSRQAWEMDQNGSCRGENQESEEILTPVSE